MSIPGDVDICLDLPGEWVAEALCAQVDPEIFFPDKGGRSEPGKSICNGGGNTAPCPVRAQCLRFALERNERHGIWGGYSERERHRLRRGLPPKQIHVNWRTCGCTACERKRRAT